MTIITEAEKSEKKSSKIVGTRAAGQIDSSKESTKKRPATREQSRKSDKTKVLQTSILNNKYL